MFPHNGFGIVADNSNQRISLFDIDTLEVFQQIPLQADVIDAAISFDGRSAVVSSFNSKTMFQLELSHGRAELVGSAVSPTFLEDVQLTPGGDFALSVDGSAANQDIVSYSLADNAFISTLPTSAQAVAISPVTGKLVLTAEFFANEVRRFTLGRNGVLADTNQEFPAGSSPINLVFSPDGIFAFVANRTPGGVSVLSTLIPSGVVLIDSVTTTSQPQSLAVSRDGSHVLALGASSVDIFSFDAVAGSLRLENSFAHSLTITPFFGVDQIALDPEDTRLFISAVGQVAVFTTYGLALGKVAGASGPGGLAICRCEQTCDPCQELE